MMSFRKGNIPALRPIIAIHIEQTAAVMRGRRMEPRILGQRIGFRLTRVPQAQGSVVAHGNETFAIRQKRDIADAFLMPEEPAIGETNGRIVRSDGEERSCRTKGDRSHYLWRVASRRGVFFAGRKNGNMT